jgi:hypothetical protein
VRLIDPNLVPALRVLATSGLPNLSRLDLRDVQFGGRPRPDISCVALTDDAAIDFKTEPVPHHTDEVDPENWNASIFTGVTAKNGTLIVDVGSVLRSDTFVSSDGVTPDREASHIYGWRWHVDEVPASEALLWASRVRFSSPDLPLMLWFRLRNMRFKCGEDVVHGWCFQSAAGPIFLVPREDEWFIAFGTSERPTRAMLVSALNAIGFALGEDFGVGIFYSVCADSLGRGMFAMDLRGPARRTSRATPALPLTDSTKRDLSSDVADLIEKLIAHQVAQPSGPISVAISHYFESLDGLVEKQFLHAWIAAEAIASWGITNGVFKATSKGRIADHAKWTTWVRSQRATIEGFANQGMADQLLGRVMESDAGRENDVQRVFKGEAIDWTAEMEDAECARNSNAHEGRMPDRARDWKKCFKRVGLAYTMLTVLLARLVGYTGAISDRGKAPERLHPDQPTWWHAIPVPPTHYADTVP